MVGKIRLYQPFVEEIRGFVYGQDPTTKLFMLKWFFSFRIDTLKELDDNLNVFNKLDQDITNIGKKVPREYKTVIFEKYKYVKNAIKCGMDTSKVVVDSLRNKELELKSKTNGSSDENLLFKGILQNGLQEYQNNQNNKNKKKVWK